MCFLLGFKFVFDLVKHFCWGLNFVCLHGLILIFVCDISDYNSARIRCQYVLGQMEKKFKCMNCNKSYKTRKHWKRHMDVECGKQPEQKCPFCELCTYYKHNLKNHMLKAHKYIS